MNLCSFKKRYKGYYYDEESEMYYCISRYYVPEWCRWLNADNPLYNDFEENTVLNLFVYCRNNPITDRDETGNWGFLALLAITLVSAVVSGTAQLVSNAISGKTGSDLWRGVAGAALGGGANALALCLAVPTGGASLAIGAAVGAIVQTGVDTMETAIRGEKIDVANTMLDLGLNFVTTLAGNYIG